jgi:hypothetical protein
MACRSASGANALAPIAPARVLASSTIVRNWWDPGKDGRGAGATWGSAGWRASLKTQPCDVGGTTRASLAARKRCCAGGTRVLNRWYAQQLHHTAIGLPFQPQPEGPVTFDTDESTTFAAFRILSTAYWMYGQQIFLLYEHFGGDMSEYQRVFLDGLRQEAEVIGSRASFARTRANDRSDGRAAAAQRARDRQAGPRASSGLWGSMPEFR